MEYLAHISNDGRIQTVEEHLKGTAMRSAAFAEEFDAADFGKLVGLAHDIGKNSEAFQQRLRGGYRVDHATAGAIECAKMGASMSACCVIGHHGGLPDFGNIATDQPGDATCAGRLKKGISGGIPPYSWSGKLPKLSEPSFPQGDDFLRSLWTRMLYSCLVDADWLDTEAFQLQDCVDQPAYDSMQVLLKKLEDYIAPWFPPKNELNRSRCQILQQCLDMGAGERGMYALTVPTGGGKTIASLAFALRHAVKNGMRRIIYVIPYTSIIEQNAAVFRKILGENNVLEHHSGAAFDSTDEMDSEQSRQHRATENWDAPVIVTTAVQFFESLYASRKSQCRKIHNIANSVVIFDEAQMIPTFQLKPCVGVIANLAAHFRVTAVLCTATQPVLNDLIQKFAPNMTVREICPDAQKLYAKFRRVSFRRVGQLSHEALADELSALDQVLCIVNTRKAAQDIFGRLTGEGNFHLSTLMCPAHRQTVLQVVRQRLQEGLPCRVVSTSLIEAGVDVDFPAVYREMAGLDSILQAAGRCNREGKRSADSSIVTIFTGEMGAPTLLRTNIGAAVEALQGDWDPGAPETIRRYFIAYRSLLGNNLDKSSAVEQLSHGIAGCRLPFATVASAFHLIDQATKTVYIPLEEEGQTLCETLLSGYGTRQTYRRAGRFGVNVYAQHYQMLFAGGDISPLDDESAVLTNMALYHTDTGLSLQADSGRAEFI